MFDLTGKKALVTGSSQGIGKSLAKCLAAHGATVYVHASSSMEKAKKAASEMTGDVRCVVANLANPEEVENLYKSTGELDILVLNASVQFRNPWDKVTAEEIETQLQVNFKASYRLIQLYAEHMKSNNYGRIVTVGSVQQYKPHKDMPIYAASKAAQMSIVTNLAKQLAPFGITVNNMSPGVIATPRNADALADDEYRAKVLAGIPVGFAGDETACDGAVLLLCAEESKYITGIDLVVDGGMKL